MLIAIGPTLYAYCNVPFPVFEGFRKAPSKGKEFNRAIKGIYEC